jgi:hypothetical protein
MLKRFAKDSIELSALNGWTQAGSEYYHSLQVKYEPYTVLENGVALSKGTVGGLTTGQFGYDAVNERLYVRLSDDTTPATDEVTATLALELISVPAGHRHGVLSVEMWNDDIVDNAEKHNVRLIREDSSGVSYFDKGYGIAALDELVKDHGISLEPEDKLLVMSDSPLCGIVVNVNEIAD